MAACTYEQRKKLGIPKHCRIKRCIPNQTMEKHAKNKETHYRINNVDVCSFFFDFLNVSYVFLGFSCFLLGFPKISMFYRREYIDVSTSVLRQEIPRAKIKDAKLFFGFWHVLEKSPAPKLRTRNVALESCAFFQKCHAESKDAKIRLLYMWQRHF